MPDIASLSALISSIKNASDIARLIKDSGATLAAAENKLKLAELIGSLADAKMGIADLKGVLEEKDAEIVRMQKALAHQATLKHDGLFYRKEGDPTPFCPRCWEKDSIAIHVGPEVWDGKVAYYLRACPECEARFKTRESGGPVSFLV